MIIKAISLWQPWATAWAIGLKKAETRHWIPFVNGRQQYCGPLAVHAAKTERGDGESLRDWFAERMEECETSRAWFRARAAVNTWADLPKGQIIAVGWLDTVRITENQKPDALEQSWGNYSPGRYAWIPCQMTLLPTPIPCIGRQGLFNWEIPADVLALPQIRSAIEEPPF